MVDLTNAAWRKSTHSSNGGNCIEVDDAHPGTVRDSKDPHGPTLTFPPHAWRSFIAAIRTGGFGTI